MGTKDNWNELVEFYIQNKNVEERKIQDFWEGVCSEFLEYKKTAGEIDSQRSIQIGSKERAIPDIILRKDKKDIIDIELKKYNACFDESMENQLISYLKQLHISVGLIVCEKIYLYSYNYSENQSQRLIIEFSKDNPKGIELFDILCKSNFDKNNIDKFIEKNTQEEKDIQNIKKELNEDLIKSLLNEYFLKNYSQEEIDKVLSTSKILVNNKTSVLKEKLVFRPEIYKKDTKDYTQYIFNGVRYGKGQLVLAVVKKYVELHPNIDLLTLQTIFYPDLLESNRRYGVVNDIVEAESNFFDYQKRYFIKANQIIQLNDSNVCVCSQWGVPNIYLFLKRARDLGFEIEEVNQFNA